jgi:hypothetical protein
MKMKEVTVAQLIAHLQSLPQEAIVRVGKEWSTGYDNGMEYENVEIEHQDVFDFRDEKYKNSVVYGKILVNLDAQ